MKNTEQEILLGGYRKIAPSDIVMLKADTNYTITYLTDGSRYLSATTLGILEERLKGFNFYRTHRSTLINMDYISMFSDGNNLKFYPELNLKDIFEIPIARRKVQDFMKTIKHLNSF